MTAPTTITQTLRADRDAIAASVLQIQALALASLPSFGDGANREAAERRAARHAPVFRWG